MVYRCSGNGFCHCSAFALDFGQLIDIKAFRCLLFGRFECQLIDSLVQFRYCVIVHHNVIIGLAALHLLQLVLSHHNDCVDVVQLFVFFVLQNSKWIFQWADPQ